MRACMDVHGCAHCFHHPRCVVLLKSVHTHVWVCALGQATLSHVGALASAVAGSVPLARAGAAAAVGCLEYVMRVGRWSEFIVPTRSRLTRVLLAVALLPGAAAAGADEPRGGRWGRRSIRVHPMDDVASAEGSLALVRGASTGGLSPSGGKDGCVPGVVV